MLLEVTLLVALGRLITGSTREASVMLRIYFLFWVLVTQVCAACERIH